MSTTSPLGYMRDADSVYTYNSIIQNSKYDWYWSQSACHRQLNDHLLKFVDTEPRTRRSKISREYVCEVRLFNETAENIKFTSNTSALDLISEICNRLNIVEKNYFGLQYFGKKHAVKKWLDPEVNISKKMKGRKNIVFNFMFQYYPDSLDCIGDYMTLYYLCEQIRININNSKDKYCESELITLTAKIIQSQYGDYDKTKLGLIQLNPMSMLVDRHCLHGSVFKQIVGVYKKLAGKDPFQCDVSIVNQAMQNPNYGVEYYYAKIGRNENIQIGVCPLGIWLQKVKSTKVPTNHSRNQCDPRDMLEHSFDYYGGRRKIITWSKFVECRRSILFRSLVTLRYQIRRADEVKNIDMYPLYNENLARIILDNYNAYRLFEERKKIMKVSIMNLKIKKDKLIRRTVLQRPTQPEVPQKSNLDNVVDAPIATPELSTVVTTTPIQNLKTPSKSSYLKEIEEENNRMKLGLVQCGIESFSFLDDMHSQLLRDSRNKPNPLSGSMYTGALVPDSSTYHQDSPRWLSLISYNDIRIPSCRFDQQKAYKTRIYEADLNKD